MLPVPLSQVRSFVIKEVSLQQQKELHDKLDPRIDDKITEYLAKEVQTLIEVAREQIHMTYRDAAIASGYDLEQHENSDLAALVSQGLKYKLEKPDQVLVRLKVEHSGYNNINNQRFGSRFVDDVVR
jgi:double-strand break repair protein MRE11